jgi:hypothetical protein
MHFGTHFWSLFGAFLGIPGTLLADFGRPARGSKKVPKKGLAARCG